MDHGPCTVVFRSINCSGNSVSQCWLHILHHNQKGWSATRQIPSPLSWKLPWSVYSLLRKEEAWRWITPQCKFFGQISFSLKANFLHPLFKCEVSLFAFVCPVQNSPLVTFGSAALPALLRRCAANMIGAGDCKEFRRQQGFMLLQMMSPMVRDQSTTSRIKRSRLEWWLCCVSVIGTYNLSCHGEATWNGLWSSHPFRIPHHGYINQWLKQWNSQWVSQPWGVNTIPGNSSIVTHIKPY